MRLSSGFVVAFVGSLGVASVALAKDPKPQRIMVVDKEKVLSEVGEGARAKDAFQKEMDKRQKALKVKQEQLEKARAALIDKNAPLTDAARKKKEAEFKALFEKTQKEFERVQQELGELRQKTLAGIMKKIKTVAKSVALKKEYTMVLDDAAVIWSNDDETDAVIEAFEDAYPEKKESKKSEDSDEEALPEKKDGKKSEDSDEEAHPEKKNGKKSRDSGSKVEKPGKSE